MLPVIIRHCMNRSQTLIRWGPTNMPLEHWNSATQGDALCTRKSRKLRNTVCVGAPGIHGDTRLPADDLPRPFSVKHFYRTPPRLALGTKALRVKAPRPRDQDIQRTDSVRIAIVPGIRPSASSATCSVSISRTVVSNATDFPDP